MKIYFVELLDGMFYIQLIGGNVLVDLIFVLILIAIVLYIAYNFIIFVFPFILFAVFIFLVYWIILHIRKHFYFKSVGFQKQKMEISEIINDYNDISNYVNDIPNNIYFISDKNEYKHSHLATFDNTSKHKYVRDRNKKNLNNSMVYPASLQVVRKASEEPIKYLCKYFNITSTMESLNQLKEIEMNISKIENTVENLKLRQQDIQKRFDPPQFILKHFNKELMNRLGAQIQEVNISCCKYTFEYVSAGGNSSQKSEIIFNRDTILATMDYIADRIKFLDSAKGQRSIMTNKLRLSIKERDNYTCQMCFASIHEQSLLLLEVDHIIPISKAGKSTPDNLQTLCWKCNRSKADKIL